MGSAIILTRRQSDIRRYPKDVDMAYRVHRFRIKMTHDQARLEQFLNGLEGEIVAIIPNVRTVIWFTYVDFLMIVELIRDS